MLSKTGKMRWSSWWLFTGLMMIFITLAELFEHKMVSPSWSRFLLMTELIVSGVVIPMALGVVLNELVMVKGRVMRKKNEMGKTAVSPPKVLLIGNASLLGASLEQLLCQKTHFQITTISAPATPKDLLQQISQYQPDTLIINTDQIPITPQVLAILQKRSRLRMLAVQGETNEIQIYEKETLPIHSTADFIQKCNIKTATSESKKEESQCE
ncbi:MAG: hypothetical protein D6706_19670 [Chloroflexi bacterium]|nr:MAG: hypothetical protein D6706_19670 [Chloroflexota bacterium]